MRSVLLVAALCLLATQAFAETEELETQVNERLAGILEPITDLMAQKEALESKSSEEEEEEALALIEEQAVMAVQNGMGQSLHEEIESAIQDAMTEEDQADEAEEAAEAESAEAEQLESNIEAQEAAEEAESVVVNVKAEEDEEIAAPAPSAQEETETLSQAETAEAEEEQELQGAEQEEQSEQEENISDSESEQLDIQEENAFLEALANPTKAVRAKVTVDEYRSIKEATVHYVKAIQDMLEKTYGGNALTIRQNGLAVLVSMYNICQKYTSNRFLCGQIRDKTLQRFMTKDLLDDAVAKKFGAMVFRTILNFAVYIKKNPKEYSGRFVNEKKLVDFFGVKPSKQGAAAKRFLRALTFEVREKYPDLAHQFVSSYNDVVVALNKKCNLISRKLFFKHDICKPIWTLLHSAKFRAKDVLTTKAYRKEFLRAILRISLKVWKKEHPKWTPEPPKPVVKPAAKKPEVKKADAKKPAAKKTDAKKTDAKKPEAKKTDAKKPAAKKPEAKKTDAKKPEAKKADAKKADAKKDAKKTDAKKTEAKKAEQKKIKFPSNVVTQRYRAAIPHDRMVITIRLNLSFKVVAGNPADLAQFIKTFSIDVARALVIEPYRVVVLSVSRDKDDKVLVKFAILTHKENTSIHSNPTSADSVDALSSKFVHATQDPKSLLFDSPVLSKIDATAEIVVAKELGSGDPTAFVELANEQATFVELGRSSGSFVQPVMFTLVLAAAVALMF